MGDDMKSLPSILFIFIVATIFFNCASSFDDVNIMTFNIRYGAAPDGENSWQFRKDLLVRTLKKHQPDILGTQESLDFQIDEIKDAFPNWKIVGVGRYHGVAVTDRPHESMSGESCRIFFDSIKFTLIDQGTFWHSDTPDIPGSMTWGNSLPRISTWAIFRTKITNQNFVVMNTHYHWDEPYVSNASRLMMRKLREIASDLPVILIGDFNLSPNSESHAYFCGATTLNEKTIRFNDAWIAARQREQNAGTYHGFNGSRNGDRIDWILCSRDLKVKKVQIIRDSQNGRYPSDHFPVAAVVRFRKRAH